MTQTRQQVRFEILDADGCLYGELYRMLIRGAILAIAEIDIVKDKADASFSVYEQKVKDKINSFLAEVNTEWFNGNRLEDLKEKFRVIYREKNPSLFTWGEFTPQHVREQEDYKRLVKGESLYFVAITNVYPAFFAEAVVLANQEMVAEVIAQKETYSVLILVSGSNRLSKKLDRLGMSRNFTHSIFTDLVALTNKFKEALPDKTVELCQLTLPDVYEMTKNSAWKIGDNFNDILNFPDRQPTYQVYDDHAVFDGSKLTMLYLLTHHAKALYKNATIAIFFRDDLPTIITNLRSLFKTHPNLLSNDVTLTIVHYMNKVHSVETIQGTGVFDERYLENIPLMMRMATTAKQATKKSVRFYYTPTEFSVQEYLDIEAFKKFLDWQVGVSNALDAKTELRASH